MSDWFKRGEGWVIGQMLLSGVAILAPQRGPTWPRLLRWLARPLGLGAIFGGVWVLRQAFGDLGENLTPLPHPKDDSVLVREGIYAQVRHPIYSGAILGTVGWALLTTNTPRLCFAGLLAALFKAKSLREEVWLEERYPEYAAYKEEVPGLLPGLW